MISISVDTTKAIKGLSQLAKDQLPFANARALTWTASDAQKAIRRELPRRFIIRNNYVSKGIRIEKATKANQAAKVGSVDEFMERQDKGGTKRPKGRHVAIPVKIKRNKRDIVTKSNRPRRILDKSGPRQPFIATVKGRLGIYQRVTKARTPIQLLYALRPTTQVKARFELERTVQKVVDERFERLFKLSLDDAIRSRL